MSLLLRYEPYILKKCSCGKKAKYYEVYYGGPNPDIDEVIDKYQCKQCIIDNFSLYIDNFGCKIVSVSTKRFIRYTNTPHFKDSGERMRNFYINEVVEEHISDLIRNLDILVKAGLLK